MMNSPTHEAIARRARKIWDDRGSPSGNDTAIWLEAERQLIAESPRPPGSGLAGSRAARGAFAPSLAAASSGAALAELIEREPAAAHSHGSEAPAPSPDEIAAKAAFQKNAARGPQLQHGKNAPKPAPPESGKPLWDKPHSS